MKFAGKKANLMPVSADATQVPVKKSKKKTTKAPMKKGGGLAAFMNQKLFGKKLGK